ncbi:excinuclease ABC subunit UvrA [Candidatus Peregrinibacteria bacterium]|nr:excinuclease ABC subunit UvrA [Candidatus Peregrinibacteria bacterium]
MPSDKIIVKGAKIHNLKNITVTIPRDKLTVITGLSGSGKSSLAFDTIYAEGQRRYVESLSTYARQFLQLMEKPDVESIDGLSPAISIDQKSAPRNPRSTVGTVTEIYDYLRLLFAKIGTPHCPQCGKKIERQSVSQIVNIIAGFPEEKKIIILAPIIRDRKGVHAKAIEKIKKDGFVRVRIDKEIMSVLEVPEMDENKKHSIEIVVDRLVIKNLKPEVKILNSGETIEIPNQDRSRLADSVETALKHGGGLVIILDHDTGAEQIFSEKWSCPDCATSVQDIEPRSFSFNNPHGACPVCHGLGTRLEIDPELAIQNPNLTLAEGAIAPWSSTTSNLGWYTGLLDQVGKKHGFSIHVPVKEIPKEKMHLILYGTGDEEYDMALRNFYEEESNDGFSMRFEGVIPNLERRYLETDSDYTRRKIEAFMRILKCPACDGKRLKPEILAVTIAEKSIIDVTEESVNGTREMLSNIKLGEMQKKIAEPIIKEIINRLTFLENVGLSYLTLNRRANTLSGGEAQRIRLATQIGSKLMGVLYVLDEPSIGLHQDDNEKLIATLVSLRDLGNTVIVVEHDRDTMMSADYIIDIGPGAGKHGGEVVAVGTSQEIIANEKSLTGQYLAGTKQIPLPAKRRKGNGKFLEIIGAREHNLKNIAVKLPLQAFIGITGVSGSGKSTLINDILVPVLSEKLNNARTTYGLHDEIRGIEHLDKVINIDQGPIGRTPRSNPATYTGVFNEIRELFSSTSEAKLRGYKTGRFSFNVKGGRCEACAGDGVKKIEMHFLPDIYVTCEECKGKRYNREALEITYRGKNIADVLDFTVDEAMEFFKNIPAIQGKLSTLSDVGLGYIHLGQSATTLSGGEAQRIKLATELAKRATGRTFYVLDEPTTGLHFEDVKRLLAVLQRLVEKGNTVLTIEHNLDVIKSADYIIDLGPAGGDKGGEVIATGTPEEVMKSPKSLTGQWLKKTWTTNM